jgi:hypothetical protein
MFLHIEILKINTDDLQRHRFWDQWKMSIITRLQMIKKPNLWYSKGKWIIEFFLKTNVNVDME